jgi:hypothetical protein
MSLRTISSEQRTHRQNYVIGKIKSETIVAKILLTIVVKINVIMASCGMLMNVASNPETIIFFGSLHKLLLLLKHTLFGVT